MAMTVPAKGALTSAMDEMMAPAPGRAVGRGSLGAGPADRGEDFLRRGVVAGVPGHAGPDDLASGRDHHRAAELRGVPDRPTLELAGAEGGEGAFGDDPGPDELGQAPDLRPGGAVGAAVLVGEDGEIDVLTAAEMGGVARRELADQDERGARRLELIPGAIQLDRVRLAIDSAVVAQPDEGRGAVAPEVAQADLVSVLVREDGVRERVGGRHSRNLSRYWVCDSGGA